MLGRQYVNTSALIRRFSGIRPYHAPSPQHRPPHHARRHFSLDMYFRRDVEDANFIAIVDNARASIGLIHISPATGGFRAAHTYVTHTRFIVKPSTAVEFIR